MISGADVRAVDQCVTDAELNVTLRAIFAVNHILTPHGPHRFKPCVRDEHRMLTAFCQLHYGDSDVEYNL